MSTNQQQTQQPACTGHVVKCAYCEGRGARAGGPCRVCGGVGSVLLQAK